MRAGRGQNHREIRKGDRTKRPCESSASSVALRTSTYEFRCAVAQETGGTQTDDRRRCANDRNACENPTGKSRSWEKGPHNPVRR
jgi:hypothetical protein